MSMLACRGGASPRRSALNAAGCSYVCRQVAPRPQVLRRDFSSSSSLYFLEQVKGFFRQAQDRTNKAIGRQTSDEKAFDKAVASLKPRAEKGEVRLARKRWGKPQWVLDPTTGKMVERILEHKYSTAYFRISHKKLQLLADQIGGGKPIDYAILQMQFSQKRAARRIKSTLALARDHAIVKGMDPTKLVVAEAWVGKGRTFKRMEIKGRGRMGIQTSFQAKMSIVLREGKTWDLKTKEKLEKEKKRIRQIGTGGVIRTNLPIINTHQRSGWQW